MKKSRLRGKAILAGVCLLLASCAPRSGLYQVPGGQVRDIAGRDDLAWQLLSGAVDESLRYYAALPDDRAFDYGGHSYTVREMEESHRLFAETIESCVPDSCGEEISRKFLFFESRNDRGGGFFTGYYEPVIPGSRNPGEGYDAPLHAVPADLLVIDLARWEKLGLLPEDLDNRVLRGRLDGSRVVPYDSREEIFYGSSLEGRAEIVAWVGDHVDLAFLQIQGSGLVELKDGSRMRVNYAGQNGHPYRAIGGVLLDRIPREKMSLQSIRAYLRSHPEEVPAILNYNPSYIFFREVEVGPLGSIGRPLTAGRSIAMDPKVSPPGGLVYIETFYRPAGENGSEPMDVGRFGVVQDRGGAIRGHGRADIFWGSGEEAERIAGPMRNDGRIFLIVARKEFLGGAPSP